MKGSLSWDTIKPILPIIIGILLIVLGVLLVSGALGEFAKRVSEVGFIDSIIQSFFGGGR